MLHAIMQFSQGEACKALSIYRGNHQRTKCVFPQNSHCGMGATANLNVRPKSQAPYTLPYTTMNGPLHYTGRFSSGTSK